jgi:hypothetical protein
MGGFVVGEQVGQGVQVEGGGFEDAVPEAAQVGDEAEALLHAVVRPGPFSQAHGHISYSTPVQLESASCNRATNHVLYSRKSSAPITLRIK